MTWNKLKNLLIILFLLINIFLIINTVIIVNSFKLSDSVINQCTSILKNGGITVDSSIIPRTAIDYEPIEFTPATAEDIKIISKSSINPDGSVNFDLKRKNLYTKNSKTAIAELGFSKNSIIIEEDYYENSYRYITARQVYENKTIFTSYVSAKISKNGVAQITFRWYNVGDNSSTEPQMENAAFASTMLIDYLNFNGRRKEDTEIVSIDTGYYIPAVYESQIHTITAIPVYCITTKTNQKYYYNAYDGSFVE